MAVNESRSMNSDLQEGITDGYVKKVAPDRGGIPNDDLSAYLAKDARHDVLYDDTVSQRAKALAGKRITTIKG